MPSRRGPRESLRSKILWGEGGTTEQSEQQQQCCCERSGVSTDAAYFLSREKPKPKAVFTNN